MKTSSIIILILINISLNAQEIVSPAGGNASGSGGSVSYTLGQVSYTAIQGSNGSLVQGVQQAYIITVVSSVPEAKIITLEWMAYPNPASDYLKLILLNDGYPEPDYNKLSYELYDLHGKLLQNNLLEGAETIISMQSFSSGTYILKITEKRDSKTLRELKTFKIIKR